MSEIRGEAGVLMKALSVRHAKDLFVAECKNGPTQTGLHRRLDAWVLVSTWSPVTTIGYEVKVDRADWRRDQKMADYLGMCHLFYVVAPKGVVPLEEVPADSGLIEAVGDGSRLVTRRRAPRREIQMPVSLMVYVLMARVQVKRERDYDEERSHWAADQLREWVKGRDERKRLSYAVSDKIRATFDDQEKRLSELKADNQRLQGIEDRIRELGFDASERVGEWKVRSRLQAFQATINPHTLRDIQGMADRLLELKRQLETLAAGVELAAGQKPQTEAFR